MTERAGYGQDQSPNVRPTPRVLRSLVTLSALLLLCWASVLLAAAAIVREPYLQQVTPTSVTVVWRTDDRGPAPALDSQVQYGTGTVQVWDSWPFTESATAVIPPSNRNATDHIVTLTGLTPGTKYFYAVGTAAGGQQSGGTLNHFFVTAPTVGTATPFRAWVVGDSGNASLDQEAVRDAMLAQTRAPDLFLHMGDIAYNTGTDLEFTAKHFAIYQDIMRHTAVWPTLGNHEAIQSPTAGVGPYYEAHVLPTGASGTEAYYSFDYANVHFIVLDSMTSNRSLTGPMLTWLSSDLASTSQEWVIAYFHHPPYTKGTHDSDRVADSGGRHTDMREIALGVLEAGGVDLVLSGHSHIYERSFLLDQAYGYGSRPNFVTPNYSVLLGAGNILDPGDGDPAGDGAYQKNSGGNSNDGAVYVVAGHGGRSIGSTFGGDHPVMSRVDEQFGSVLLDFDDTTLTVRNLRANGTISDTFVIQKIPGGTDNAAPQIGMEFNGTTADRVGPGNTASGSDGGSDGVFTITLEAGGLRTVTGIRVHGPAGGTWDTDSGTGFWIAGAAPTLNDALLNDPGNVSVNFELNQGDSFVVFVSDVDGLLFNAGESILATVVFDDGSSAEASVVLGEPVPLPDVGPRIGMEFNGTATDRVGPGNTASGSDGGSDGVFTVTLEAGGLRTVTGVHVNRQSGGTWDTDSGTGFWIAGVASTLNDALLNDLGNASVNFALSEGDSFIVFISDVDGLLFNSGESISVTVVFDDGTRAAANVVLGEPVLLPDVGPRIGMEFNGTAADRVGPGNTASGSDGGNDGVFAVTLEGGGLRTVTGIHVHRQAGGTWDTDSGTGFWIAGAALTLNDALLNDLGNVSVNFALSEGDSFIVFISDVDGLLFNSGESISVTVVFDDGTRAAANVVLGEAGADPSGTNF